MAKISQIAADLFGLKNKKQEAKGLFVSLEELMDERKNVAYLQQKSKLRYSTRAGDVKSAFKGRGIEMEEIRAYGFGDDVRDIDWRVTARKNQPYTKVYSEEKDREMYVLLDMSSSMVFGTKKELKSVTAGKVAAILGWLAQENKDRFGGVVFDGSQSLLFKPQHNRAHLLTILKKISDISLDILAKEKNIESIKKPIQLLTHKIKGHSTVFIISDFYNFGEEEKKAMAALAKKSQVFCFNIYDILEEIAPKAGEYMIENNGETLVFDSRSVQFRQEYQKFFNEKREKIISFCKSFNCRYIEIRTDILIFKQMKFI